MHSILFLLAVVILISTISSNPIRDLFTEKVPSHADHKTQSAHTNPKNLAKATKGICNTDRHQMCLNQCGSGAGCEKQCSLLKCNAGGSQAPIETLLNLAGKRTNLAQKYAEDLKKQSIKSVFPVEE